MHPVVPGQPNVQARAAYAWQTSVEQPGGQSSAVLCILRTGFVGSVPKQH